MSRGPWERHKPAEYYSASEWDKLQWACGIPSRFWKLKPNYVIPATFQYESKKNGIERVTAAVQQEYLTERLAHPELLSNNRLVCITSYPSDEHGMAAACLMARSLIEKQWQAETTVKVRVDDIQDFEQAAKLDVPFFSVEPDMLLIHNINENTPRQRLALVRDLLLKYEGTYRGVVAACENPLKFAREVLHIEPQEFYHFEGRPKKVIER
jgi:hypothetical protein